MEITGLMARRLLVNWRIPLAVAIAALPRGVRPKIAGGHAVAGLCLVRLEEIRLAGMPACIGVASENLAIRMGVEWDGGEGVLIFRRETSSRLNAFLGARSQYGEHHHSIFKVHDDGNAAQISVRNPQGHSHFASVLNVQPAAQSVFQDLNAASHYFAGGECGYSPGRRPGVWEGLRLRLHRWQLSPVQLLAARSTMIEQLFAGHAVLDSAFIMRNIEHTWTPTPAMHWGTIAAAAPIHAAA